MIPLEFYNIIIAHFSDKSFVKMLKKLTGDLVSERIKIINSIAMSEYKDKKYNIRTVAFTLDIPSLDMEITLIYENENRNYYYNLNLDESLKLFRIQVSKSRLERIENYLNKMYKHYIRVNSKKRRQADGRLKKSEV